jgi:hypothetical protein
MGTLDGQVFSELFTRFRLPPTPLQGQLQNPAFYSVLPPRGTTKTRLSVCCHKLLDFRILTPDTFNTLKSFGSRNEVAFQALLLGLETWTIWHLVRIASQRRRTPVLREFPASVRAAK